MFRKFALTALVLAGMATASGAQTAKILSSSDIHEVKKGDLQDMARVTGRAEAAAVHVVSSRAAGTILRLFASSGDRVEKGDLLLELDSQDHEIALARAVAQYDSARSSAAQAAIRLSREESLNDKGITSSKALDDARFEFERARAAETQSRIAVEQAELDLERMQLRAPISGKVIRHDLQEGMQIGAGGKAFTIVDDRELDVTLIIAEKDAPQVQPGATVALWPAYEPARRRVTTIDRIDPVILDASRSVTAHAKIASDAGAWRPGAFLLGEVLVAEERDALSIPATAVLHEGDGSHVLKIDQGKVESVPVTLAEAWNGGRVLQVLSGLSEGDVILSQPLSGIKAGVDVEVRE